MKTEQTNQDDYSSIMKRMEDSHEYYDRKYMKDQKLKQLVERENHLIIEIENLEYELDGCRNDMEFAEVSFDIAKARVELDDIREKINEMMK